MRGWYTPTFDHHHRPSDLCGGRLIYRRALKRPGVRGSSFNFLVVHVAQWRHMVTDHQNKCTLQLGQGTDLHATAGTT